MTTSSPSEPAELRWLEATGPDGRGPAPARDPNGDWARMCYVINDFRWLHGRWPTRFRMSARQFASVRDLFSPQDFAKLTAKLDFIADGSGFKAEDERGASCGYRQEFLRAADWLGVLPQRGRQRRQRRWWQLW